MSFENFVSVLSQNLPVLFAYIGWARRYDGTEQLVGNHRELEANPADVMEVQAFVRGDDGLFRCGVGRGNVESERFHVAFVALRPGTQMKEIIGLYLGATAEMEGQYAFAVTSDAVLIPPEQRPMIESWLAGQSMRRWATRTFGSSHPGLLVDFEKLKVNLPGILFPLQGLIDADQTFSGMAAIEGKIRESLVRHRSREGKLRDAKIQQALAANGGRLLCEVPECGFDFFERYGQIGHGFALVHHRQSLSQAGDDGKTTTLGDLAIVCANCHAMIHRGGECRDVGTLISGQAQE